MARKDFFEAAEKIVALFENADPQDPLWYGAEHKTQMKSLRQDIKEINKNMETASDMDEVTSLQKADKILSAVVQVVEASVLSGEDSPEFVKAYDFSATQLNLPPAVCIKWPRHFKWARCKAEIQQIRNDTQWFSKISSTEFANIGLAPL